MYFGLVYWTHCTYYVCCLQFNLVSGQICILGRLCGYWYYERKQFLLHFSWYNFFKYSLTSITSNSVQFFVAMSCLFLILSSHSDFVWFLCSSLFCTSVFFSMCIFSVVTVVESVVSTATVASGIVIASASPLNLNRKQKNNEQ